MKNKLTILITVSMLAGLLTGCVTTGTKFGAPTKGMSTADYQALVFLDPQNTVRSDWGTVKDMPETASSADLGGSSKYSNENFED